MLWQRSCYAIKSLQELKLLQKIFKNVNGEIKFNDKKVPFQSDPFGHLPVAEISAMISTMVPINLHCRFVCSDTIKCISLKIKKINPETFVHANKNLILEYSKLIDEKIIDDLNRRESRHDIARIFKEPIQKLNSMEELIYACRCAEFPTHIFPSKESLFVFNNDNFYLPQVSLSDNKLSSSTSFDLDDGILGGGEDFELMTNCYLKWKENAFIGSMSDYCEELKEHLDLD